MTHPIRIAFCITELDPGGAERAFVRLVCGLNRDKWLPEVYCLGPEGELATPIREAGIPVTCFGFTSRKVLRGLFRLRKELRRQKPEILQTFLFHANLLGRLAAFGTTSVKHIVCGVRVAERRSPWYLRLDRWTSSLVSRFACVSQSVANFSTDAGLNPKKMVVIPNGVDVSLFDQTEAADLSQFGIPSRAKVIITAGRLDPQKGILNLLDAFAAIAASEPEAHLIIAGEGPQRAEIESHIRTLSLENRAHLIGRRNDLPALLKASQVFVLSSLWEGMPNVVLEAAAAGTPIVATDVEGVAEVLGGTSPDGGFTYGEKAIPGDAASLRIALENALKTAVSAKNRALIAREFVRSEFSWERMVARYDDLYSSLLGVSSRG
ncbi:MAG: glycosyltransferase [Planctomycetaceae bacterium]|nr:glycosyltransferase [Planctomycetaceae bacterium]